MDLGKTVIIFGVALVVIGLLMQFAPQLRLGKLPGDISFGSNGWTVYIPIGTSILISVILTLVFNAIGSASRR